MALRFISLNLHFNDGNTWLFSLVIVKVPLLWVRKSSYFGFGSPQQLSLSYNMHLFLPYLLNDSQTIRSTIHLSKPLLCVTLICGDWSHFHFIMPVMPDKAAFVSAVLFFTALPGKPLFSAPKAAPIGKEWIYIFIQTNAKRPTSGRAIC